MNESVVDKFGTKLVIKVVLDGCSFKCDKIVLVEY